MPKLHRFSTPARQVDFPNDPSSQEAIDALWSTNVNGFTQQAIAGNPWNSTYASDQTSYYNPLDTDIPDGTGSALVSWGAFPNRLLQYLGAGAYPTNPYNQSPDQLLADADTGQDLQPIPTNPCANPLWTTPPCSNDSCHPYGPYGPRGWLDEYCEWSVTRNAAGKITRIDFACENPEYWYTLWRVSPSTAASIYESTLNYGVPPTSQITVTVEDLQLVDPSTGEPVVDPSTGQPAYNPLNKWNSGPVSTRTGSASDNGGAMHLTSTPNTLQTELGLAGGASVLRTQGNVSPAQLICCSQYGQNYRNSDPHIGQSVNQVVAGGTYPQGQNPPGGNIVSLADPPGLYIQMPTFTSYALPADPNLPAGAQPSDCWQVIRGTTTLTDPLTRQDFPGNFILHAAFQLPAAWIDAGVSFTVSDITISGSPIEWGGQIAQTFQIGLFARPIPATPPAVFPCVGSPAESTPQPLQVMYQNLWDAYYGTTIANTVGVSMNLASNTVIVPPMVEQGSTSQPLALLCAGVDEGQAPVLSFPSSTPGDITATATAPSNVNYAVPGNSYPSENQLVTVVLDVAADADLGLRSLQLANQGATAGPPGPAFINVVPAGTFAQKR